MRILGLDLGTRTLGVAITKTGLFSNPYGVLRYKGDSYKELILEVVKIIEKEQIEEIVLGYPKNMNNTCGEAVERSIRFKKELESFTNVPIYFMDERLSTVEATNILLTNDLSRKKRKEVVDAAAAMIILDTYIKRKENLNEKEK